MATDTNQPTIAAWLAARFADFQAFVASAMTDVDGYIANIKSLLGWADAELPKVSAAIAATAGMLSVYFPGAAEAEAFLAAVEDAVNFAETMVKGADGVIAGVSQALAPTTPVTGAEKNQVMNQAVDNAGYAQIPTPVVNHFAESNVLAIHGPAQA